MPDPTFQTVSASQAAMLFNVSPYGTRFSLYQAFRRASLFEKDEQNRMAFGRLVEPWIIDRAGKMLNLEVKHHAEQQYIRHPEYPIGCTRDAEVYDPVRGRGVIEAKAVDWMVFKNDWTDRAAPRHIEIQLAAQMIAEDVQWGVIAVMVGNNDKIKLYMRERNAGISGEIIETARNFLADVAEGREPDPWGDAIELQAINHLYPAVTPEKRIEKMDDEALGNTVRMYEFARQQVKIYQGEMDRALPTILAAAEDARWLRVAGGLVRITKFSVNDQVITLPPDARQVLRDVGNYLQQYLPGWAHAAEVLHHIANWHHVIKAGGIRTKVKIEVFENEEAASAAPELNP